MGDPAGDDVGRWEEEAGRRSEEQDPSRRDTRRPDDDVYTGENVEVDGDKAGCVVRQAG